MVTDSRWPAGGVVSLFDCATLSRLLAVGISYPSTALLGQIRTGSFAIDVANAACRADLRVDYSALHDALSEGRLSETGLLEGEYTRLFERTVPCPLNESAYLSTTGTGAVHDLADVASYYAAFGFRVAPSAFELADHLSAELEFIGVLCAKELYALARGWDEQAVIAASSRRRFAAEHVAPWVDQLAKRLAKHASLPFYAALIGATVALTHAEAARGGTREAVT